MSKLFISIRGINDIIDPSYRYKMEALNILQNKGKFVITNINEIGLNLSSSYHKNKSHNNDNCYSKMLIEFFKKKFGIAIKCNKDLTKVELKGISHAELQNAVYEFIEYFVICPTCNNPETNLYKHKSDIYITCNACSYNNKLDNKNKIFDKLKDNYLKIIDVN